MTAPLKAFAEESYREIFDSVETTVRKGVSSGHSRCARGFLQTLHDTFHAEFTGLVVMQGNQGELKTRYLIQSVPPAPAQSFKHTSLESIVKAIRAKEKLHSRNARSAFQHFRRMLPAQPPLLPSKAAILADHELRLHGLHERLRENIVLALTGEYHDQRDGSNASFKFKVETAPVWKKHVTRSLVEGWDSIYLMRVWPASGWRFAKDRSAWVFIVNPSQRFPEKYIPEGEREYLERKLYDILSEWFSTKATILQRRRWLSRSERGASAMGELYKETLIWPIEARDFAHFLDDFARNTELKAKPLENIHEQAKELRTISNLAHTPKMGPCEQRCLNCPGANGCPQDSHDSHIIGALADLHVWSLNFHHFGASDEVTGKDKGYFKDLLAWGLKGLKKRPRCWTVAMNTRSTSVSRRLLNAHRVWHRFLGVIRRMMSTNADATSGSCFDSFWQERFMSHLRSWKTGGMRRSGRIIHCNGSVWIILLPSGAWQRCCCLISAGHRSELKT